MERTCRYGDTGYLYNIHSLVNPDNGEEEDTYVGTLNKFATYVKELYDDIFKAKEINKLSNVLEIGIGNLAHT